MSRNIYFTLLLLCGMIGYSHGQTRIYVSPSGKDTNSGSMESPFQTVEKARNHIRSLRSEGEGQGFIVYLREGVYRFSQPLVLSPEDSGSKDAPVIYMAYPNEKVVFSGSMPIKTEWEKYNDSIWVTNAKMKSEHGFTPRTIWVDGDAKPLARYPDLIPGKRPFGGVDPECISEKRVAGWKSPEGAYVHGMQHGKWGSMHYLLVDVKEGKPHLMLISTNTTTMYNGAQLHRKDRFVENVFEELDAPGEWFYDKLQKKLYYYPDRQNADMRDLSVEVPVSSTIVRMEGTESAPVKYIYFEGIGFEKTRSTWFLTQEHLPVGDYAICRDATVVMEGTENCKIENCRFEELGGNGVVMSNYNRYSAVEGCRFENLQANGVVLVGSRDAMRDSPWCEVTDEVEDKDLTGKWGYILSYRIWKKPYREYEQSPDTIPGPKTGNYPRYCRVENNLMTRIGELEQQSAGVLLSMCAENKVIHNTIYDLPRAGICINDGSWGGHEIAYNDVFHTVLATADHGPFNSWGRDRHWSMRMHGVQKPEGLNTKERSRLDSYKTTTIHNNRFGHTVDTHSYGIDLDDGSSNYHIYNNLTIGCSFKLREGFYRIVENNICISSFPPGKHVCFDDNEDVIRNNIIINTESDVIFEGIYCKPDQIKECDYNVYYSLPAKSAIAVKLRGATKNGFEPMMTLKAWKRKGLDLHSVAANPQFKDFERMDLRLKDKSPAFKMGFKEFPLDEFGSTVPEYRKEAMEAHAKYDKDIFAGETGESKDDQIHNWMGAQVKNMTTDTEKSAAGIDDIKGVILVNVPGKSVLYKAGGRSGDVILEVNGKGIRTMKDLQREVGMAKGKVRLWVDGNPPAHELMLELPK